MTSTDKPAEDHAYFQAVESCFIRLRGAPLLLSPADWQLTRSWHREGIPLELVLQTLEEVFAARRARGSKGKVQGLRYCAPAVEKAWSERAELTATGTRQGPAPIDISGRLRNLSELLEGSRDVPIDLADRVAGLGGTPEAVEAALTKLDREMIASARSRLVESDLSDLMRSIDDSMAKLDARVDETETQKIRERLVREGIRRRLGLPLLSLFAVEIAKE